MEWDGLRKRDLNSRCFDVAKNLYYSCKDLSMHLGTWKKRQEVSILLILMMQEACGGNLKELRYSKNITLEISNLNKEERGRICHLIF